MQVRPRARRTRLDRNCYALKNWESEMATLRLIEHEQASAEVRAVYDGIIATRKTDWISNFWKALARDPATLRCTWYSIKRDHGAGCDRRPD